MTREVMEYDVVIVGGGPSGLATAIKLKQLNADVNVCVLEKGAEIGSHILSGNVFETRALDELVPNWKELNAPIKTKSNKRKIFIFGKNQITKLANMASSCSTTKITKIILSVLQIYVDGLQNRLRV